VTPKPLERILVANRGEIAVRILRAVREAGGVGLAVYSEADEEALHVRIADEARLLGPPAPKDSYLDIDRLLEAAKEMKAEAVHPGYGFLAENPEFARRVREADLVFLGPDPETMEALGSKQEAKAVAEEAGVPVVPGFRKAGATDEELISAGDRCGFPLLVKASAGGGGRGMRLVESATELPGAIRAARREAEQAFGNGELLLERRIHPARHVEIQILGDGKGGALAFPERECSIQRRHQKILEESPSPAVDPDLRGRMQEAALALARRVAYLGAGTVEFLLDEDGAFYFLEVNTRLQVEHPVTEWVSGQDLVQAQIRIARGRALEEAVPEHDPTPRGWALEARICAEDVERDFLPCAGRIELCREATGPGVRIDSGVYEGFTVPMEYDSLLAKVIVHAPDRPSCLRRMEDALRRSAWLGLPTNLDFLIDLVRHEDFRKGRLRTDFLGVHASDFTGRAGTPPEEVGIAAALAPLFRKEPNGTVSVPGRTAPPSPWNLADGFRLGTGGPAS